MHDLDRTTLEIGEETTQFEFPQELEFSDHESPFNEVEEAELATQLLEVTDEAELDQFIGSLIKKAAKAAHGLLRTPLGRQVGGLIKGAIKKALPMAGGALGGALVPGAGNAIGSQLGSAASRIFGLELEGAGTEEMEFEVARRLVRLAGSAVQNATDAADAADPKTAANAAVVAAAKAHAPGLLGAANGAGKPQNGRATSGRWYRRGGKIIVVGI